MPQNEDHLEVNMPELELAKLEITVRLAEFNAVRTEIITTLTQSYQTASLTLAGIGTLIASSPLIISTDQPVLFLVASLLFDAIALIQLRYSLAVFNMSNHIGDVVAPAIRNSLSTLSPSPKGLQRLVDVLTWEKGGRPVTHSNDFWLYPIEMARQLIVIIASAMSAGAFYYYMTNLRPLNLQDWVALFTAASVLSYTSFVSLKVRNILQGDVKKNLEETVSVAPPSPAPSQPDPPPS